MNQHKAPWRHSNWAWERSRKVLTLSLVPPVSFPFSCSFSIFQRPGQGLQPKDVFCEWGYPSVEKYPSWSNWWALAQYGTPSFKRWTVFFRMTPKVASGLHMCACAHANTHICKSAPLIISTDLWPFVHVHINGQCLSEWFMFLPIQHIANWLV